MTADDERDRLPEAWAHAARLGPSLEFEGELHGPEDLVIQGRVRGRIDLPESRVFIAETAQVEAEVRVRDVVVRGQVSGNITASGRAVIEKTGRLDGDLAASAISVEDGARFKGSVRILRRP